MAARTSVETIQNNIYTEMIRGKVSAIGKPKCIIAYGPPASGKGVVTKLIKTKLNLTDDAVIDVNVDNVVAQVPAYKEDIKKCISYFSSLSDNKCSVDSKMVNLLIGECTTVYMQNRTAYRADEVTDKLLDYAITNKINFVFETTGNTIGWTISNVIDKAKKQGFEIILFFPIVNSSVIKERLFSRAKTEGRIPSPEYVITIIGNAHSNLKEISKSVDKLFLYNNNRDAKLLLTIDNGLKTCNFTQDDVNDLNDPMIGLTVDMLKTECPLPALPPTPPVAVSPSLPIIAGGGYKTYTLKILE